MSEKESIKAAIVLLGTNSFTAPSRMGEFLPLAGFKDPVYQGRLFELDEVNDAARFVFDQKNYPANYRPTIKIVFPEPVVEVGELKGSNELREELDAPNGGKVNKSKLIKLGLEIYGYSNLDWNNLPDRARKNFMLKALAEYDGEVTPTEEEVTPTEEEVTPTEEEVTQDEPVSVPYDRVHSGAGKWDVYDKDGVRLHDNITKEAAVAMVPERPEEKIIPKKKGK